MPMKKVVVALVRPSPLIKPSTKNFKSKDYEIFLTITNSEGRQVLGLPSFDLKTAEEQTKSAIRNDVMNYMYEITKETSKDKFGVKIKRIIFAKNYKIKIKGIHDVDAQLFIAVTSVKHSPIINNNESSVAAGFYCFYDCIKESSDHPDKYLSSSKHLLEVYENWFKKIQTKPVFLQGLFRPSALERIYENVTNPAFASDASSDWTLLENNINARQLMDKMMRLNETDIIVHNPSFGIESNPYNKVDMLVVNKFFMRKPDYSKIIVPDREEWFKGGNVTDEFRELSWEDEFLLHKASADGDVAAMVEILRENPSRAEMWDNDGWAPVHYACWYGRTNALSLLLQAGCDPNITNRNQTNILHLAAGCGHPDIIEILLNHSFIDHFAEDKSGRTALMCCEEIRSRDWQKCSNLLKAAANKSPPCLIVKRLDGMDKKVKMLHGSNTTMQHMMNDLNLPIDTQQYFTIWLVSKNLHLQLKPEHRPLIELKKWPAHIWTKSTETNSEPQLFLKRDVKLLPSVEENVEDPLSVHLLYSEAKHQVMCGLYPCSDEVAIALAAIVACITYGQSEAKRNKPNFLNDKKIHTLLPSVKLKNKLVNWKEKLLIEYKEFVGQSKTDIKLLQLLYLRYCWTQIPLYGCAFFNGFILDHTVTNVCIGVNYRGIHIIKSATMEHYCSLSYHSLTWELKEDAHQLQLKTTNEKLDIVIQSYQASLICSLMSKLSITNA